MILNMINCALAIYCVLYMYDDDDKKAERIQIDRAKERVRANKIDKPNIQAFNSNISTIATESKIKKRWWKFWRWSFRFSCSTRRYGLSGFEFFFFLFISFSNQHAIFSKLFFSTIDFFYLLRILSIVKTIINSIILMPDFMFDFILSKK